MRDIAAATGSANQEDGRGPGTKLCSEEQSRLAMWYHSVFWMLIISGLIVALSLLANALGRELLAPSARSWRLFVELLSAALAVVALSVHCRSLVPKFESYRKARVVLREADGSASSEIRSERDKHSICVRTRKTNERCVVRTPAPGLLALVKWFFRSPGTTTVRHYTVAIDAVGRKQFRRHFLAGIILLLCLWSIPFVNWCVLSDPKQDALFTSVLLAAVAGTLVGGALALTFCHIKLSDLQRAYQPCLGCWYEARTNECEQGILLIPQQPANTYSTIAFAIGGVFIAVYVGDRGPAGLAFMFSMIAHCIASALYHGLSTRWNGHLDVIGIYWVFGGLLSFAVGSFAGLEEHLSAMMILLFGMLLATFLRLLLPRLMMAKVGLILLLIYGFEIMILRR